MDENQITEGLANTILSKLNELTILSKTYFTVQEASVFLGISRDTVRRYMYSGELAYSKPTAKKIFISKADIDKFINKSRVADQSEIQSAASDYLVNRKR